nr:DNA polymerase processivity subunit [Macropodid alphaherpesvirus 2]
MTNLVESQHPTYSAHLFKIHHIDRSASFHLCYSSVPKACGSPCGSLEPRPTPSTSIELMESAGTSELTMQPTCTIILQGEELTNMLKAFAPLRTSLTDSRLVFGRNQLLIHCWLFGEQIFWPIASSQFTSYRWMGPPAAFSTLTNGKQSLLGAFKSTSQTLHRVEFLINGQHPFREILQRVWISEKDSTDAPRCVSLLKKEVASFMVMVPQVQPDVCIWLNKTQMGKIWPLAPKNAFDPITFEVGPNGKFSISTSIATLSFIIQDETTLNDNTNPQLQILSSALKNTNRVVDKTKTVRGVNTHRLFVARLQSGSFADVIKRLQMGGCVFKFCISETIPTLWVTSTGPNATSVLFLLNKRDDRDNPSPTLRSGLPYVVTRPGPTTESAEEGPDGTGISSVPLNKPPSVRGTANNTAIPPSMHDLREPARALTDILDPRGSRDTVRRSNPTPCSLLHDTLTKRFKSGAYVPAEAERQLPLAPRAQLVSRTTLPVPRIVLPAKPQLNSL